MFWKYVYSWSSRQVTFSFCDESGSVSVPEMRFHFSSNPLCLLSPFREEGRRSLGKRLVVESRMGPQCGSFDSRTEIRKVVYARLETIPANCQPDKWTFFGYLGELRCGNKGRKVSRKIQWIPHMCSVFFEVLSSKKGWERSCYT